MTNGFQAFGRQAWQRGLREAVRSAEERLKAAGTDEQRQSALQRQQSDEKQHGRRRLY